MPQHYSGAACENYDFVYALIGHWSIYKVYEEEPTMAFPYGSLLLAKCGNSTMEIQNGHF